MTKAVIRTKQGMNKDYEKETEQKFPQKVH